MIEVYKRFVIYGNGLPCGSFDSREEAYSYARALEALRGLRIEVKDRGA